MIVDRIKRMAQFIFDDYMKVGKRPHIFGTAWCAAEAAP